MLKELKKSGLESLKPKRSEQKSEKKWPGRVWAKIVYFVYG